MGTLLRAGPWHKCFHITVTSDLLQNPAWSAAWEMGDRISGLQRLIELWAGKEIWGQGETCGTEPLVFTTTSYTNFPAFLAVTCVM